MSKFSSYLLWICSSRIVTWMSSQQQLRRLVSVEVVRYGFDLMTAEFASDFHQRTLNRCTFIHISHLPQLLLSSRRITTSLIIWAFGLQTVAYSQVQRFHSPQYLAGFVWMNRAIQAKTRGTFSTSCRPSYWWNSFSCQSTVTATITSRTILYSAWDSALIVGTGFGHHTLRP